MIIMPICDGKCLWYKVTGRHSRGQFSCMIIMAIIYVGRSPWYGVRVRFILEVVFDDRIVNAGY